MNNYGLCIVAPKSWSPGPYMITCILDLNAGEMATDAQGFFFKTASSTLFGCNYIREL